MIIPYVVNNNKQKVYEQEVKDSISSIYSDSLWQQRVIIDNQQRELVGSAKRFDFAVSYYTSTDDEQRQMEDTMSSILSSE